MIWPHLSVLLASMFLVAMGYWRRRQSRRLSSWEELAASIRSNAGVESSVDRYGWNADIKVSKEEIWERIGGASGLANIFHNAGVYAKLADYAMQRTSSIPEQVIEEIYTEATQVRLMVVFALASYLIFRTTSCQVNAYRSVQLYCAMTQHLTSTFQNNCPRFVPKLMEAL